MQEVASLRSGTLPADCNKPEAGRTQALKLDIVNEPENLFRKTEREPTVALSSPLLESIMADNASNREMLELETDGCSTCRFRTLYVVSSGAAAAMVSGPA
jgi:hypothetical protein